MIRKALQRCWRRGLREQLHQGKQEFYTRQQRHWLGTEVPRLFVNLVECKVAAVTGAFWAEQCCCKALGRNENGNISDGNISEKSAPVDYCWYTLVEFLAHFFESQYMQKNMLSAVRCKSALFMGCDLCHKHFSESNLLEKAPAVEASCPVQAETSEFPFPISIDSH